jgi:hypothetical protein
VCDQVGHYLARECKYKEIAKRAVREAVEQDEEGASAEQQQVHHVRTSGLELTFHTTVNNDEDQLGKFQVLLDNQSTKSVIRDVQMLKNIQPCTEKLYITDISGGRIEYWNTQQHRKSVL